MNTPFNRSTSIEKLHKQIEEAVDIENPGGTPCTHIQIVTIAYNTVRTMGVFKDACREWRRKPALDKTWGQFNLEFALAY